MQEHPNSTHPLDYLLAATTWPREWKLLTGGLEKPHAWPIYWDVFMSKTLCAPVKEAPTNATFEKLTFAVGSHGQTLWQAFRCLSMPRFARYLPHHAAVFSNLTKILNHGAKMLCSDRVICRRVFTLAY
jgi:hypothetical protein